MQRQTLGGTTLIAAAIMGLITMAFYPGDIAVSRAVLIRRSHQLEGVSRMQRSARSIIAVVFFMAAAACGTANRRGITDPRSIAENLRGTWTDTVESVLRLDAGVRPTVLQLGVVDTVVSGTGTYMLNSGPGGRSVVSGVISRALVRLVLRQDNGIVGNFEGTLTAPNLLGGTVMWFPGDGRLGAMGFRRTAR